jgi:hypothetical protein
MRSIKKIIYNFIILLQMLLVGCDAPAKNDKPQKSKTDIKSAELLTDSTNLFFQKMKDIYPYFDVAIDSSKIDLKEYDEIHQPNLTQCKPFVLNRNFIGKVANLKVIVKADSFSRESLFLQSGNLKLWACNLYSSLKVSDTMIVTGLVYNVFGNEQTWGLPVVLTQFFVRKYR